MDPNTVLFVDDEVNILKALQRLLRQDDMNVLCLGERVIGIAVAREVTDTFMAARFSDEERHRRRLDKLLAVEGDYMSQRTEN